MTIFSDIYKNHAGNENDFITFTVSYLRFIRELIFPDFTVFGQDFFHPRNFQIMLIREIKLNSLFRG